MEQKPKAAIAGPMTKAMLGGASARPPVFGLPKSPPPPNLPEGQQNFLEFGSHLMTHVNLAKEAHQLAVQTATGAKMEQAVKKSGPTSRQAKAKTAIANQQA